MALNYLPHMVSAAILTAQHTTQMRFRLGCAVLAVTSGLQVFSKNKRPRSVRFCTKPDSCGCMQNKLHIVLNSRPKLTSGSTLITAAWLYQLHGDMKRLLTAYSEKVCIRRNIFLEGHSREQQFCQVEALSFVRCFSPPL